MRGSCEGVTGRKGNYDRHATTGGTASKLNIHYALPDFEEEDEDKSEFDERSFYERIDSVVADKELEEFLGEVDNYADAARDDLCYHDAGFTYFVKECKECLPDLLRDKPFRKGFG